MTIELENKLSFLGITGGHTPVVDIFRKMAPGYPTPGPAEFSQTPITSTSANLAISTAAGGNKWRGLSLYTPLVPKTAILRVTTRCSQILRPSTVWGGQLYPLKTRILAAAAFVTSAVNDKKDNLSTTLTKSNTSKSVWQISAERIGL